MSEEEIIKILKILQEDMSDYNSFMVGEFGERQIEAIQCLLDLYNKQKEELKRQINTRIIEEKFIENNYISKDKIREQIRQLEEYYKKEIEPEIYNWTDFTAEEHYKDLITKLEELLEE